jgi:hypothetical protein
MRGDGGMAGTTKLDDRTIRVFISSTFRDMRPERNVLVQRVFPQIRDLCAKRGVTFTEIDLRWGLTDEEVAEGKVLPICLEEIKRCKPYFIGLLGERYGWVPNEISPEVAAEHPWLLPHVGKTSVTELEILYGVLNDDRMVGKALFYEREPGYVGSDRYLADTADRPEDRLAYEEDRSKAEVAARNDLRKRLHASRHIVEPFADPDDLADKVLDDLTARVDQDYPEDEAIDPMAAESRLHEFYAESRSTAYVRRPSYFDALDDFADGGVGVFTVLGDSGSGKSALLATWAREYRARQTDGLVLMHFIGSSPKSAALVPMLQRLNHELARYLDIEGADLSSERDELQRTFEELLSAASRRGRVTLLLDGLNELTSGPGFIDVNSGLLDPRDVAWLRRPLVSWAVRRKRRLRRASPLFSANCLEWLPSILPDRVALVVSTLPGPAKDEVERRGWLDHSLKVRPLDELERRTLIDTYLGVGSSKRLSAAQKRRIVAIPQTSSPLYLRLFLDELQIAGRHESLDAHIDQLAQARSIPELLQVRLERLENEHEHHRPGLVADALVLMWTSYASLDEASLLDLLGGEDRLPAAQWAPLRSALSDLVLDRSGHLTFAHAYIRSAVEDRYLADSAVEEAAHVRHADYFADSAPALAKLHLQHLLEGHLFRQTEDFAEQATLAGKLAHVEYALGDTDSAKRILKQDADQAVNLGEWLSWAQLRIDLASICLSADGFDDAMRVLTETCDFLRDLGYSIVVSEQGESIAGSPQSMPRPIAVALAMAVTACANLQVEFGEPSAALLTLKEARQLATELDAAELLAIVVGLEAKVQGAPSN